MKIGNYVIPEKLTHAPWFEIVKLGAKHQQNQGRLSATAGDIFKTFAPNAPGNEVTKSVISFTDGDESWLSKYLLGNAVPQVATELLQDWKKSPIKEQSSRNR